MPILKHLPKVHLIELGFKWKCYFDAQTKFLKMHEKI